MYVFWGFNICHVDKEIQYCTQQIESNIWKKINYSWLRKNKIIYVSGVFTNNTYIHFRVYIHNIYIVLDIYNRYVIWYGIG